MDEYTNIDVRRTCKSFLDDSSQQKQLARINRHPAFFQPQHSFSAPQLYPEFLKLFAPHFSPYHYNSAQMDLERLFNKPVSQEQQQTTAKQHPPQGALAPSRPALVPLQQVRIAQRMPSNQLPPKKAIQRHPILNVKVVNKVELPPLEPLPPIEDSFMEEVKRIETTQGQYKMFFGRMMDMMDTLCRRYDGLEEEPEPMADSDDEETEEPPPPPSKRQRPIDRSATNSPDCDMSDEEEEEEEEDLSKYPERIELPDGSYKYVLGPNGTTITSKEYGQVAWPNAPVATRGLLMVVFTSDDLATHTLTGKPSPAFYGRERPPKKMLDPDRVEDIIVTVMNRTGGKERHIRGTITTKCADTAKKYKRRAKKLAESEAINQGQGQ